MVSAAYAIRTVGRLFTGPVRSSMLQVEDLRRSELFAALVLAAGIIILGVLPSQALELMTPSITQFSNIFSHVTTGVLH